MLESAGVIRRVVGPPDAPTSVETLEVPADIFFQRYGLVPLMSFDKSSTVIAGCIRQPETSPTGQCYIGST